MYYPYFRGKKHELNAILTIAEEVRTSRVIPIVEPVNSSNLSLSGLRKIRKALLPFIFIINPKVGKLKGDNDSILELLNNALPNENLIVGFLIKSGFSLQELRTFLESYSTQRKSIIFAFTPEPREQEQILNLISNREDIQSLVFDKRKVATDLSSFFAFHPNRITLKDGFQKNDRNADYPNRSFFDSDYQTFRNGAYSGFGDFLTIGDDYSDSGGQPYVVALHLTHLDAGGLIVSHSLSTSDSKIAGLAPRKFNEAVKKLVAFADQENVLETSGLASFRDWNERNHFPQLGMAKEASMVHHASLMISLT